MIGQALHREIRVFKISKILEDLDSTQTVWTQEQLVIWHRRQDVIQ
jgi:hypothetical protein